MLIALITDLESKSMTDILPSREIQDNKDFEACEKDNVRIEVLCKFGNNNIGNFCKWLVSWTNNEPEFEPVHNILLKCGENEVQDNDCRGV